MIGILAAAEHGSNGVHLAADRNEIIWGSLAFLIVLILLVVRVGPLVRRALRARTARIAAAMAEARTERAGAEAAAREAAARLDDIEADRAAIRAEVEASAEVSAAALVARAADEAEQIRRRGRAEVDSLRRQAAADLTADMAALAVASTEAVVRDSLDADTRSGLVDDYITQLATTR